MTKEQELLQRVMEGISALQSVHKEILEKHSAALHAHIDDLLGYLSAAGEGTLSKGTLKDLLEELGGLKLKPEKGRGKDLYRIEKTVEEMVDVCKKR